MDHDGFIDILLTSVNNDLTTLTILLDNNQGASLSRSPKLKDLFQLAGNSTQLVTFIDIDEDGRIDYILQQVVNGVPSLKVIYNNLVSDSFFIKALMLNSKLERADNIYGDSSMGVSFRFVVTDLDDQKYVVAGSQAC